MHFFLILRKEVLMQEIKKLKEIMKRENLSPEQVSRELKISYRTVYRIIDGKTKKPMDLVIKAIREFIERHK